MKQSALGLPPMQALPRSALAAYKRLLATIRSAGWTAVSVDRAREAGSPYLEVERSRSYSGTGTDGFRESACEDFEISSNGESGISIRYSRSPSFGLEEVRRQFIAMHVESIQDRIRPLRWRARVPLRGVRIDKKSWLRKSIHYDLEKYAEFGINALLVDALDPPSSNGVLSDETRSTFWESRLRNVLEVFGKRGWWRMPVLPIELDLGTEGSGENEWRGTPLCRQDPRGRRRLLHRFESLVRLFPKVEAVGLTITEWDRCPCDSCARTSFQEEVAYYLRAYFAVLKRYAGGTELWILPDERSWEALQEVGLQVPEPIRWLETRRREPVSGASVEVERNVDGMQFPIPEGARGRYLDPEVFESLNSAPGLERPLRLAVAKIGFTSTPSVQFAAFLGSVWEVEGEAQNAEEWLYRLVLPPSEWRDWRSWKARNALVRSCFASESRNEKGLRFPFETGLSAQRSARSTLRHGSTPGQTPQTKMAELACRNGGAPYSILPGPQLIGDLVAGAKRWLGEREVLSILSRIDSMPETAPIDSRLLSRIADLRDALNEFLESTQRSWFEIEELRGLESLRDHLGLLLGRKRNGGLWCKKDLPKVWLDLPEDSRSSANLE